jgi:hypothetical protein
VFRKVELLHRNGSYYCALILDLHNCRYSIYLENTVNDIAVLLQPFSDIICLLAKFLYSQGYLKIILKNVLHIVFIFDF